MRKTLFLFWHGLGDNVLATPCIKRYKETTGDYVGWMMLEKFKSSEFFKYNPYIDELHWCSDAWHVAGHDKIQEGTIIVKAEAEKIKEEYGYDRVVVIDHASNRKTHKIHRTAHEMGIEMGGDLRTYFYNCPEEDLQKYYDEIEIPDSFVFFNGRTALPAKDLSLDRVKKWMEIKGIGLPIVSPDFTWDTSQVPIHFAADVMRKAHYVALADSALYHVAHALDLNIDLAYFQRGKKVWDIVHPLHSTKENVIF